VLNALDQKPKVLMTKIELFVNGLCIATAVFAIEDFAFS
jgi:hypothetical protein